jgi:hypothetical protein
MVYRDGIGLLADSKKPPPRGTVPGAIRKTSQRELAG